MIGQYDLLIADACSGLNSMVALTGLGLIYVYVVSRYSRWHNALLLLSVLPVAFAANVIRVMALLLVTYYFGRWRRPRVPRVGRMARDRPRIRRLLRGRSPDRRGPIGACAVNGAAHAPSCSARRDDRDRARRAVAAARARFRPRAAQLLRNPSPRSSATGRKSPSPAIRSTPARARPTSRTWIALYDDVLMRAYGTCRATSSCSPWRMGAISARK